MRDHLKLGNVAARGLVQTDVGRHLAVFGALGVVWAAQLAAMLRIGCYEHDTGLVYVALPAVVPLAMCFLGVVLARVSHKVLTASVLVPMTGLVAGVVSGLVWWPEPGALEQAITYGLLFGCAAFVLLLPVVLTMRSAARRRSLLDVVNYYSTWAYAAGAACVSALLTALPWRAYPGCTTEPWQSVLGTLASIVVCLSAAGLLFLYVRKSRWALTMAPDTVDVGLMETAVDPPQSVYRDANLAPAVRQTSRAYGIMKARLWAVAVCAVVALPVACVGIALSVSGMLSTLPE